MYIYFWNFKMLIIIVLWVYCLKIIGNAVFLEKREILFFCTQKWSF